MQIRGRVRLGPPLPAQPGRRPRPPSRRPLPPEAGGRTHAPTCQAAGGAQGPEAVQAEARVLEHDPKQDRVGAGPRGLQDGDQDGLRADQDSDQVIIGPYLKILASQLS